MSAHPALMWQDQNSEISKIYNPVCRAFIAIMALYYAILVFAHMLHLSGGAQVLMGALAGLSAVIALALYVGTGRERKPFPLEPAMAIVYAAICINIIVHAIIARDPGQFDYLVMMTFCSAMLSPSLRCAYVGLAVSAFGMLVLALHGIGGEIYPLAFTGMTCLVGAAFCARWLRDMVHTQVRLRAHTQALLVEVDCARKAAEAASAAKDSFLANMSHEIRTPLNGVIGVAESLARTELTDRQREMIGLIQHSGETLERLLGDILDVSKIEAGKLNLAEAPFDLREAIETAATLMRVRADEKGISFDVTFDLPDPCWVLGDVVRVRQIVSNLASNAVKFTAHGGVSIRVRSESAGHTFVMEVEDSGIGFESEQTSNLFDRFEQADSSITRRYGGTGLGLAICAALTERMGGQIRASSTPGVGSLFVVELPLRACKPPKLSAASSHAEVPAPAAGLRVLVADDHPMNQRVVALLLQPLGAKVTLVANGQQALEAVALCRFDVILMDMQMPVMDGLSATRAIRTLEAKTGRAHTPIAMLSANAMTDHVTQALAAGCDAHIAKPVTPKSLHAGIVAALAQATRQAPTTSGVA